MRLSIERFGATSRGSTAVAFGDLIQFAVTPRIPYDASAPIDEQARQLFAKADDRLAQLSSNKSGMTMVLIILADIKDYVAFNSVWDQWIDPKEPPARACISAVLADPAMKVEMLVTAVRR
ncbi:MAG: hypothetical protein QOJ42_7615 [Acidobacteriaceae bacterium]|jgi:enamine deaminase RidA (YjgF/YER057c/UK114 family)|nr:hypothetical protein [Acidobacteriaceae bacterium]